MLNNYFDKIYLINLDKRTDRLEKCNEEFTKICSTFTRVSAIDGSTLGLVLDNNNGAVRWNSGAYALVKTTINILQDAIDNNYQRILIFEDDIEFTPLFNIIFQDYIDTLPEKYDLAFFGITHTGCPNMYNTHWDRIRSAFSCHAYSVGKHILPTYKRLLENLDKPIDYYTNIIIGSRMNSFATHKKLVYQINGYSDIEGDYYNVDFTR